MPIRQKTTVYLDRDEYQRLKSLARRRGESPAALIREAVAEYGRRHSSGRGLPQSLGAGKSGRKDLSERAEELLQGLGQDGERADRDRR